MASISSKPPQTYSRLFRPWDGKSAKAKDLIKVEKMFSDELNQQGLDPYFAGMFNTVYSAGIPMPESSPVQLQQPQFPGHPFAMMSSDPSDYLPLMSMVDPITRGLMEQEYVRVMTEEAQTKMLSLRKQRPKKFKCPHCNVAFSNNGQLKGHVRIHTGERPFKCDDKSCGKTFTRNEELTRHKRIHTGLRPFGCSMCGKKFGRRDHLKKHTKIHFAPERFYQTAAGGATTVFLPYPPPPFLAAF